ncbi:24119_t:CDS:2 [Gigaspora rosea]|nr:24119_t:CDS:2 [Gigaspora rosea]
MSNRILTVNDPEAQPNGIWYKPVGMGANKLKVKIAINVVINLDGKRKITNHSARRTAIMILKASDVPEDEAMIFSGHRGIRSYSSPTDDQSSIALLIPYATYNEDLESYYSFPGDSYQYINYESDENEDNNEIQGPDSSVTNSSSNTISNTSSNTISNTSPNTISNDTISNANSNTVLNASSNIVSNTSSNTVSNASSNTVSNASSNTVSNASFNIMSNSSQPSVAAISNKIPLSKKRIIPISNMNPKLTAPFKVPRIYHQNQQKLPAKNKEQVTQTKENETTYAINNDHEQISITNNKERKVLQHITNNTIIQIPDTSKPIDINLKISFNN